MKRKLCIIVAIILSVFLILQTGRLSGIKVGIKADNTEDGWQFISKPGIDSPVLIGDSGGVTGFIIDPENPRHMVIICWIGPFRESFDGGKTWANIPFSKFGYSSEGDNMLTNTISYVNGEWYFDGPSIYNPSQIGYATQQYIHKTKDFTNFEEIVCPTSVESFWTDGKLFYIGGPRGPGRNETCFFVSRDGGVSWENLSNGILQLFKNNPYYIGISKIAVFKGKVFIGVAGIIGPSRVCYDGNNFSLTDPDLDNYMLYALEDRLWAISQSSSDEENTIIKESFNGINWHILIDKAPIRFSPHGSGLPDEFFQSVGWDPISKIFIMISNNNVFYSNNGKSWIPDSAGLDMRTVSAYTGKNCFALSEDRIYLVFKGKLYVKNLPLMLKKHVVLRINDKQIIANGQEIVMETAPVIKNDRTFLPIRYISEPLGAQVQWNTTERKVTVSLGSIIIELWIGKSIAKVNGVNTPIDQNSKVVPYIDKGRTMLPLRFISENLGSTVYWDPVLRLITVVYPKGE